MKESEYVVGDEVVFENSFLLCKIRSKTARTEVKSCYFSTFSAKLRSTVHKIV